MKILLLVQYYIPEAIHFFVHEVATGLVGKGYDVTVLTAFPHYGAGRIYDGYRGKVYKRETIDGVRVHRSWVFATPSKRTFSRILSFASFSFSSLIAGLFCAAGHDLVYVWMPPLPLGVTGALLAKLNGSRFVLHIQDIYPRAAIEHGVFTNRKLIKFFESVERWIYRRADQIVVISNGFKEDLISKGVAPQKINVVENWANADFIKPGPRNNPFRRRLDADELFVLTYSGGLNNNANIEPVLKAAKMLCERAFPFCCGWRRRIQGSIAAFSRFASTNKREVLSVSTAGDVPECAVCGRHEFGLAEQPVSDLLRTIQDLQANGSGPADFGNHTGSE